MSIGVRVLSPAADLVVVGGMPGAGKTTAIAAAVTDLERITVLDPERLHRRLRRRLPERIPYRAYRLLIHTGHTLAVLGRLLLGPRTGHRLVLHDPGTRPGRRRLFLTLAELRGWRTALVYVDVDRSAARIGQLARGRAQRPGAFDRHWERWLEVRDELGEHEPTGPQTPQEVLVSRDEAASTLRWLLMGGDPERLLVLRSEQCRRAA